eukprot:jgi/Bigna1/70143/fgenesh1_pg.11_\
MFFIRRQNIAASAIRNSHVPVPFFYANQRRANRLERKAGRALARGNVQRAARLHMQANRVAHRRSGVVVRPAVVRPAVVRPTVRVARAVVRAVLGRPAVRPLGRRAVVVHRPVGRPVVIRPRARVVRPLVRRRGGAVAAGVALGAAIAQPRAKSKPNVAASPANTKTVVNVKTDFKGKSSTPSAPTYAAPPPPSKKPSPTLMRAVVPQGVTAGHSFQVQANGQIVSLVVPKGMGPGSEIQFQPPPPVEIQTVQAQVVQPTPNSSAQYQIVAPQSVEIVQPKVVENQKPTISTVPPQNIEKQMQNLDLETKTTPSPTPTAPPPPSSFTENPQLYDVQIPECVGAGQSFAVEINGQQFEVEAPEGTKAGDNTRTKNIFGALAQNQKTHQSFRKMSEVKSDVRDKDQALERLNNAPPKPADIGSEEDRGRLIWDNWALKEAGIQILSKWKNLGLRQSNWSMINNYMHKLTTEFQGLSSRSGGVVRMLEQTFPVPSTSFCYPYWEDVLETPFRDLLGNLEILKPFGLQNSKNQCVVISNTEIVAIRINGGSCCSFASSAFEAATDKVGGAVLSVIQGISSVFFLTKPIMTMIEWYREADDHIQKSQDLVADTMALANKIWTILLSRVAESARALEANTLTYNNEGMFDSLKNEVRAVLTMLIAFHTKSLGEYSKEAKNKKTFMRIRIRASTLHRALDKAIIQKEGKKKSKKILKTEAHIQCLKELIDERQKEAIQVLQYRLKRVIQKYRKLSEKLAKMQEKENISTYAKLKENMGQLWILYRKLILPPSLTIKVYLISRAELDQAKDNKNVAFWIKVFPKTRADPLKLDCLLVEEFFPESGQNKTINKLILSFSYADILDADSDFIARDPLKEYIFELRESIKSSSGVKGENNESGTTKRQGAKNLYLARDHERLLTNVKRRLNDSLSTTHFKTTLMVLEAIESNKHILDSMYKTYQCHKKIRNPQLRGIWQIQFSNQKSVSIQSLGNALVEWKLNLEKDSVENKGLMDTKHGRNATDREAPDYYLDSCNDVDSVTTDGLFHFDEANHWFRQDVDLLEKLKQYETEATVWEKNQKEDVEKELKEVKRIVDNMKREKNRTQGAQKAILEGLIFKLSVDKKMLKDRLEKAAMTLFWKVELIEEKRKIREEAEKSKSPLLTRELFGTNKKFCEAYQKIISDIDWTRAEEKLRDAIFEFDEVDPRAILQYGANMWDRMEFFLYADKSGFKSGSGSRGAASVNLRVESKARGLELKLEESKNTLYWANQIAFAYSQFPKVKSLVKRLDIVYERFKIAKFLYDTKIIFQATASNSEALPKCLFPRYKGHGSYSPISPRFLLREGKTGKADSWKKIKEALKESFPEKVKEDGDLFFETQWQKYVFPAILNSQSIFKNKRDMIRIEKKCGDKGAHDRKSAITQLIESDPNVNLLLQQAAFLHKAESIAIEQQIRLEQYQGAGVLPSAPPLDEDGNQELDTTQPDGMLYADGFNPTLAQRYFGNRKHDDSGCFKVARVNGLDPEASIRKKMAGILQKAADNGHRHSAWRLVSQVPLRNCTKCKFYVEYMNKFADRNISQSTCFNPRSILDEKQLGNTGRTTLVMYKSRMELKTRGTQILEIASPQNKQQTVDCVRISAIVRLFLWRKKQACTSHNCLNPTGKSQDVEPMGQHWDLQWQRVLLSLERLCYSGYMCTMDVLDRKNERNDKGRDTNNEGEKQKIIEGNLIEGLYLANIKQSLVMPISPQDPFFVEPESPVEAKSGKYDKLTQDFLTDREIKNTKPYSEDSRKEAKEISKKAWKRLREWVAAATECEVDPFQLKIDCYKKLAEISEGGTKGLCILRMLSVSREMRVPREAVNKWIEKGYSWIEGSEDKYREYFAYFVFIIYWNMIYFKLQISTIRMLTTQRRN